MIKSRIDCSCTQLTVAKNFANFRAIPNVEAPATTVQIKCKQVMTIITKEKSGF